MKTVKQLHRPIDPLSVETYWRWGFDTYEIALRTGCKESDVHRHLVAVMNCKWLERRRDQDRISVSPQR